MIPEGEHSYQPRMATWSRDVLSLHNAFSPAPAQPALACLQEEGARAWTPDTAATMQARLFTATGMVLTQCKSV